MRQIRWVGAGLATALALWVGGAQAQTAAAPEVGVTTGTLAGLCAAGAGTAEGSAGAAGACRGFIVGAGQYHSEMAVARGSRGPAFCLPTPSPSLEAAGASFAAWAQANPQFAGEKAVVGLMRWATATYPCPTPPRAASTGARR